jgi:phage terminase large subunit-like protein
LRASLAALPPTKRAELIASLTTDEALALAHDWQVWARDEQLAPRGGWFAWLVLAGRGFGKTRTGAEWVLERVRSGARRIALVAPTAADARDTMVEGESGILARAHPDERPIYEPSKRRLTWPRYGAIATCFAAEKPDRLRGPQHDTAWCDELCAWKYPQATWDMLVLGMRLGDPRICVTTTPRPIPTLKDLLRDPATTTTRGSTYDNSANLARRFLARLKRKHEGTRLGRQELFAEILEDTPGALWTLALFERNRALSVPDLSRLVVAVDPQASAPPDEDVGDDTAAPGAETGIVAAGVDARGEGYVLADRSGRFSPADWGERAVLLHDELRADCIVGETNNGGAMVEHVVTTAAEKLHREKRRASPRIAFRAVTASRGKETRAEPIAALDEQGRIHHVGVLAALEDQCSTWVPGGRSPDRLDARVWALSVLMLEEAPIDRSAVRSLAAAARNLARPRA